MVSIKFHHGARGLGLLEFQQRGVVKQPNVIYVLTEQNMRTKLVIDTQCLRQQKIASMNHLAKLNESQTRATLIRSETKYLGEQG